MGGMKEVILSSTILLTIRMIILILCLRIVLELPEDFSSVLVYHLYLTSLSDLGSLSSDYLAA